MSDVEMDQFIHLTLGCGPIVTEDDPDDDPNGFDRTVLGPTPNKLHYGYCPVCHKTFRWDIPSQRWVDYDPAAVMKAARDMAEILGVVWDLASEETRAWYVNRLLGLMAAFE